jgi:hypothetical protein
VPRLHRLGDHADELTAQRVEVDLLAQAGRKPLEQSAAGPRPIAPV